MPNAMLTHHASIRFNEQQRVACKSAVSHVVVLMVHHSAGRTSFQDPQCPAQEPRYAAPVHTFVADSASLIRANARMHRSELLRTCEDGFGYRN